MNFPTRWQSAILDALRITGRESIASLAERLDVSDETIRRHVKDLVEQGAVHRVHGGVILAGALAEPPFSRRIKERVAAKRAIAKGVVDHVSDGMTLLIDSGSTTTYVAQALLQRSGLTVITNSLEIARTLVGRGDCSVHFAGGALRADIGATIGHEAIALIREFRADLAILSMGAIDVKDGYMDFDIDEARIARTMIDRADRVVVAADAWKFTAKARVRVCSFEPVSLLVTDETPPPQLLQQFTAAGTEIVVATDETVSDPV
ncbi:DeoR/GlpR family DNA-binding transcription regulator [Hyphomicrobium sp. LHD-15]|uniref:DeoR/GlpR family DNA-binding transcription regulator n=1 Tax=Hyphomicrobium sp. LHD-15 TaxID=3072142 RepID=UPI00280C4774|nr:DeoR/GlpR family DNA-binding transcription regulator [Hyphomicrobium sp. LHD-15]MDQ8699602.1 DeoR/GlpR family DNA-binding transcription regulator [Hyphomicrobium sp. LHD-15]